MTHIDNGQQGTRKRASCCLSLLAFAMPLASPQSLDAQQSAPRTANAPVRGVAFDSLRAAPLRGAMISAAGAETVFSDSLGRFELALAPGRHSLTLDHPALDSIGLFSITRTFTVGASGDPLVLAIPSFRTLWRSACGVSPAPADSGFIFGTVHQSDGRTPARDALVALVALAWNEFGISRDKKVGMTQQRWGGRVPTDATGAYAVCGVPVDVSMRMRAATDSVSTEPITLITSTARVQRRDFVLPATGDAAGPVGAIRGVLRNSTGQPVPGATVRAGGVREVRSDEDGRFLLVGVPVGTQEMDVRAIGLTPTSAVVDVIAGDTVALTLDINKVQVLETVRVRATRLQAQLINDFEKRRTSGLGKYLDSTSLGSLGTMHAIFAQFPSATMQRGFVFLPGNSVRGQCRAHLILDGRIRDQEELQWLRPSDIAAVEFYARGLTTPSDFPTSGPGCGTIVVWTKAMWP